MKQVQKERPQVIASYKLNQSSNLNSRYLSPLGEYQEVPTLKLRKRASPKRFKQLKRPTAVINYSEMQQTNSSIGNAAVRNVKRTVKPASYGRIKVTDEQYTSPSARHLQTNPSGPNQAVKTRSFPIQNDYFSRNISDVNTLMTTPRQMASKKVLNMHKTQFQYQTHRSTPKNLSPLHQTVISPSSSRMDDQNLQFQNAQADQMFNTADFKARTVFPKKYSLPSHINAWTAPQFNDVTAPGQGLYQSITKEYTNRAPSLSKYRDRIHTPNTKLARIGSKVYEAQLKAAEIDHKAFLVKKFRIEYGVGICYKQVKELDLYRLELALEMQLLEKKIVLAATYIQSVFRARRDRSWTIPLIKKRRVAAIRLQRLFRGAVSNIARHAHHRRAATIVQKFMKGYYTKHMLFKKEFNHIIDNKLQDILDRSHEIKVQAANFIRFCAKCYIRKVLKLRAIEEAKKAKKAEAARLANEKKRRRMGYTPRAPKKETITPRSTAKEASTPSVSLAKKDNLSATMSTPTASKIAESQQLSQTMGSNQSVSSPTKMDDESPDARNGKRPMIIAQDVESLASKSEADDPNETTPGGLLSGGNKTVFEEDDDDKTSALRLNLGVVREEDSQLGEEHLNENSSADEQDLNDRGEDPDDGSSLSIQDHGGASGLSAQLSPNHQPVHETIEEAPIEDE